MKIPIDKLTENDFAKWPVWEFCNDDTPDETAMTPVKILPVDHLTGRVVGVGLVLANGQKVPGLLGNINVRNLRKTEQYRTVAVFKNQRKFRLNRYFDLDERRLYGPEQLAGFLGLPIDKVFPMTYDLGGLLESSPEIARGRILAEPAERLSAEERRKL